MKKIKILLTMTVVLVATLCCTLSASALTDGEWEFKLLNNEVIVTGYTGQGGNVVIPETIYGCPVVKVDLDRDIENATEITFPSNVTEVQNIAGGDSLKKVNFNEGLKIIGYRAFEGCKNLEYADLPSTVEMIEERAFIGCKSLKSVTFPAGLKEIDIAAYESTGVESVDFGDSNPKIGEFAFLGCKQLKKLDLGTALTTVSDFSGCSALEEIIMPNTLKTIEGFTFRDCVSLKQVIFPTSLVRIGDYAFIGCSGLQEVVIPYGVVGADYAFSECENLQAVYVPDTVTSKKPVFRDSDNAIVYCNSGSKVEEICQKFEISHLTDTSVNSGIHVYYNGKRISFHSYGQNPEILEGRTLVPLRSIFEAMGATVEWDGDTRTATAKRGNVNIKIQIGASEIYKNGTAVAVDVPAQIVNDRTMVPARVIAEAFGADVQWNGNGRTVLINE